MQRTLSAATGWSTLSAFVRAVIQLAQLIFLTRLLSPQDYGLMAMVMVVISYAALFSDMGLSTAFVQREHISREERSSLYWLSVLVGGILMVLVMSASPLIGYILKEPRLPSLISLISTNFLVVALGQQLRIDAEKELNFRPLALIEIFAAFIGFAIAVFTAWLGWGVYALVAGFICVSWITMMLCWAMLAQGWRPMWHFRWKDVNWFLRFGGGMVMNNAINHVNSTVDMLIAGRMLGVAQLGLFSVPRNLILQVQSMINPIFTRVGFPVLASIQHDKKLVQTIYLRMMNLTASVNAPIYVALAVFSPEFTQLLLGEDFQDTYSLLRVLALWGLLRSFGNPAGSLVFGLGRIRLATAWNLCLLMVVPPALWIGSLHGAFGMACAMASVMAALFIPGWAILIRPTCGASLWDYSRQVLTPTLCSVIAGVTAWLAISTINLPWPRLGLGLFVGAATYAAFSWLLNPRCMDLLVNFMRNRPAQ
jgi:O-antigen/teichoic acid export membrane protein